MSGRTRKASRYVKRAMCQAVWAASHTKDTYLSAFYRRMRLRKGAPKAVMALAEIITTGGISRKWLPDYWTVLSRLGYYAQLTPIGPAPKAEDPPAPQANQASQLWLQAS
jgi:hypothetical protein